MLISRLRAPHLPTEEQGDHRTAGTTKRYIGNDDLRHILQLLGVSQSPMGPLRNSVGEIAPNPLPYIVDATGIALKPVLG